jgi:hypothetical protein
VNTISFRFRSAFNWTHRIIGNVAFLFAIVALFLAFGYRDLNLPIGLTNGLIFYVVFHIFVHLLLTFQTVYFSFYPNGVGDQESAVSEQSSDDVKDSRGSTLRKVVAIFYFVFVWIFAFVFLGVIADA